LPQFAFWIQVFAIPLQSVSDKKQSTDRSLEKLAWILKKVSKLFWDFGDIILIFAPAFVRKEIE